MNDTATADLLPLQPQHLDSAWQLTRALSWPHRLEDWQLMHDLGEGAIAAAAGRTVGSAMWWRCGADAATIGMVIVDQAWRGRGLGRRLMDRALDALAPRSTMLNATTIGVPLYRATGFEAVGTIHQYQAALAARAGSGARPQGVRTATRKDDAAILDLDSRAFGAPRQALLGRLLDEAEFLVATRGAAITGFACRRRFGRGALVGPVAAEDEATAAGLVAAWLGRSEGFVRADIPGDAAILAAVLTDAGLAKVDEVVTMRRGAWPVAAGVRVFGLASQALG